uniref:Uncharacterized protein n=1 Tax=Anguilla anguilla TaxID=7936 RepID=A0A0E9UW18_ANGAN
MASFHPGRTNGVGSKNSKGGPLMSKIRREDRLFDRSLLRDFLSVSLTAENPLSHSAEVAK